MTSTERIRQWRIDNPEKDKIHRERAYKKALDSRSKLESSLRRLYGLTLDQYDDLVSKQKGLCAICGGGPNGRGNVLHVDHDHKTGKVRGLLCGHCNHGLGKFRDNPELLTKAINYLTL